MINMRLSKDVGGRIGTRLSFLDNSTQRPMKFKRQGGVAMVLGIFIGGIFLGFSVGFATMALVAARNLRLRGEEAQEIGDYPACAYPRIRKFSPSLRARTQASRAWFTL